MALAYNSKQFSNALARHFYLAHDDVQSLIDTNYQSLKLFFAFFQNAQAITDLTVWNSWVINPSGTIPSVNDIKYPIFFNQDASTWRNKFLYSVPCTRIEMVRKDSAGSIEYNGQKWSAISAFDERTTTTGQEPRYLYVEADLKYYNAALDVSTGIASKNIITGCALYKTEIQSDGSSGDADFTTDTDWSSVEYDPITGYSYWIHDTINAAGGNTQYNDAKIISADLVYMYQNTFPGLIRSNTINTKFSLIIEF